MAVVSTLPRKKSWQVQQEAASLLIAMAERQGRIGSVLEHLRERHSLSQEDAAHRAGLTTRQWQRIEKGDVSKPYPSTLQKIATAYDISPSAFFEESANGNGTDSQLDRIERKLDRLLAEVGGFRRLLEDGASPAVIDALTRWLEDSEQAPEVSGRVRSRRPAA